MLEKYGAKLRNEDVAICQKCSSDNIHYDPECGRIVCMKCGEDNGKIVIDIFERESPFLFRNILDYRSSVEVLLPLKMAKVKPWMRNLLKCAMSWELRT